MARVTTQIDDGLLVVTFDNPPAMNAWTMHMQQQFTTIMREADTNRSVRAVVLTGIGDKAFCAGQHLGETQAMSDLQVDDWLSNLRSAYASVLHCDKPTVAALNGVAAGSGYQLTLLCDLRIAHAGVRLGQPEVNSGIPSITGGYLTRHYVGHGRTTEMMLRGELLGAEEALGAGLLHEVTTPADVLHLAMTRARELADKPTAAFTFTKRALRASLEGGLWEAFDAAAQVDRQAWRSGEPQQVMERFFARTKSAG
jgi:enoyl-CoA hydratase/carnithine racemase